MGVHCHDVVGVALHEELLTGCDVLADEDASCGVVDGVVLED